MEIISNFLRCNLPHCPYCSTKLFYLESLVSRGRMSFKCPRCRKKSEVVLKPIFFKLLTLIQIISLITFAIVVFLGCGYCLIGLVFITLIFGGFYVFSPFMVDLNLKIEDDKKVHQDEKEENIGECTDEELFSN